MFGGYHVVSGACVPFSDTWAWDGFNWAQQAVGLPGPAARLNQGMAFDGQEIVLFGGYDGIAMSFSDTWVWDGNSWTQRFPANSPSYRSDFGMTYDSVRHQVVLFSGFGGSSDTWVWDGTNWAPQYSPTNPPGGWNVMAFDSARQQIILITEPLAPGTATQTWSWDGNQWTRKNLAVNPSQRLAAAMAFDAVHQQTVLFGGSNGANILADTWVLLAPSNNVVPQALGLANDGSGHYLVTATVKNQGDLPLTSITLTTAKVGSITASLTTPATLVYIPPGSTASFTVEVTIASVPGTAASLTFQGTYSTATVTNTAWTASVRSVSLP
jgi:hypothetical protein